MSEYTQSGGSNSDGDRDYNRVGNESVNNNYVDFNQFILQHNLVTNPMNDAFNMSSLFDYYQNQVPYMPTSNFFFNGFQQPTTFNPFQNDIVATSNLLPTAEEFIPRFQNLNLSNAEVTSIPTPSTSGNDMIGESTNNTSEFEQGMERSSNSRGAISKNRNFHARKKQFDKHRRNEGRFQNENYKNRNHRDFESMKNSKYHDNRRNNRNSHCDKRDTSDSDESFKTNTKGDRNSQSSFLSLNNEASNEKLSQREKLIREIDTRKLECLVCVEQIRPHQSVWSCTNCYHILHLACVTKWALSSKSEDGWRCPACQNTTDVIPFDYYCFCSKIKNPQYNRNDLAHSCGEVCGRKECCQHSCTLLCHPGPCPPCQANVIRECGCGKISKTMQCCIKEVVVCEEKCDKLLNCEIHTCEKQCHHGKCPNCEHKVHQKCNCGKQERQTACTRDSNEKKSFSCGKPCNKNLACGNHKCKEICHSGECKPCKLTPSMITSCPCGKMPVVAGQRKSCLDPIPVCNGICGKILKCGPDFPHHCNSKCHTGNCPPCNRETSVKCRCGHMRQMMKCRQLLTRADDIRCKKRCTKKRSCGKHKCNQECCIDIDHICPLSCNYNLSCGKHKCDQSCHRGNCPPCYRSSFDELYCECGANVIYPPVPCGTKRPACNEPCSRQHACTHPVQHNCHSGSTCPPCMVFTTKYCFGGHEQRKTIPCSQESFSCGLPCGKELNCGRHKCIRPCHDGPCQTEDDICKQSCTKTRNLCGHKCNAPCHVDDCPETPCKEMVEVTCECGNRKQMRTCHDFSSEFRRIATAQLASSMQEMQRGNLIELSDIMGPIKMTNNKTLECNDECKLLERNRRLAAGFQIRNPDVPSKILTRYSDFIRNWFKKDPQLVKMIHDTLTNLVKLAKESKQKSRSHSFPTMNREKRHLVHEMCGMFGVDSVAYDAEPNRNVVATAYRERCWVPAMSIMEVMQRENGQRRVPVPNNNAWGVKK